MPNKKSDDTPRPPENPEDVGQVLAYLVGSLHMSFARIAASMEVAAGALAEIADAQRTQADMVVIATEATFPGAFTEEDDDDDTPPPRTTERFRLQ